jgi:hypothetical protein
MTGSSHGGKCESSLVLLDIPSNLQEAHTITRNHEPSKRITNLYICKALFKKRAAYKSFIENKTSSKSGYFYISLVHQSVLPHKVLITNIM